MLGKWDIRFGGPEFPPVILFKVFLSGACGHAQYFSGKEMIQPATNVRKELGREGGSKGMREGGREGQREEGREGRRDGEKKGWKE